MPSTIRTFIAIPLPPEVIRQVEQFVRALRPQFPEFRWTDAAQWHITTNFLGNVPDARTGEVCQVVREIATARSPFVCSLDALGAFPKVTRPRILWLGLAEGGRILTHLHYRLADALEDLNIETDRRKYRPHLTLARLQSHQRWTERLVERLSGPAVRPTADLTFEVDELVVYASFPESTGPVYTPMDRIVLTG